MKRELLIPAISIAALAVAICLLLRTPGDDNDVASKVFGGQKAFDIFKAAKVGTIQRLHPRNGGNPTDFSAYARGEPLALTSKQLAQAQQLFSDKSAYGWDYAKGCIPEFGALVRFGDTHHAVDIALCFQCKQMTVFDSAKGFTMPVNEEGDFDPIELQLVGIVKSIFPHDSEIQALRTGNPDALP